MRRKAPLVKKAGSNFSEYMEKKMATERRGKNNLLGVQKDKAAPVPTLAGRRLPPLQRTRMGPRRQPPSPPCWGSLFRIFRRARATKSWGLENGRSQCLIPELLQKIAKDAGMNESQLTALLEKMKNQDGKLNLADFLASFSRHFQSLQDEAPVTAPETDLPLLQSVLERLGVPVPEVSRISEAAVRGDNTIDLQKILAGLQDLPGVRITDLTAVEAEQLQDILANAGVSQQLQRALVARAVAG